MLLPGGPNSRSASLGDPAWLVVYGYITFAAAFYFFVASASLSGALDLQMFADSLTYEEFARSLQFHEVFDIDIFRSNYFGPCFLLHVVGFSREVVFVCNAMTFLASMHYMFKLKVTSRVKMVLLIALNPLVFFSLFGVNKEIFSLLSVALLLHYLQNRASIACLAASMLISGLVRWPLLIFIIIAAYMVRRQSVKLRWRLMMLIGLLAFVSFSPTLMPDLFGGVRENSLLGAAVDIHEERTGSYRILNGIQDYPLGYLLAFIPKALLLHFGLGFRIYNLFDPVDFWNNFVITLFAVELSGLLLVLWRRRRFKVSHDVIYIALIYAALVVFSPIYSPRYLLPLLLCYVLVLLQPQGYAGAKLAILESRSGFAFRSTSTIKV